MERPVSGTRGARGVHVSKQVALRQLVLPQGGGNPAGRVASPPALYFPWWDLGMECT
jgi:hypothetical protein